MGQLGLLEMIASHASMMFKHADKYVTSEELFDSGSSAIVAQEALTDLLEAYRNAVSLNVLSGVYNLMGYRLQREEIEQWREFSQKVIKDMNEFVKQNSSVNYKS